jgi:hypothetical protein
MELKLASYHGIYLKPYDARKDGKRKNTRCLSEKK